MKKFFSGILVGLLLAFIFVGGVADTQLKLIINGKDVTATAEPILHDGKTYTPARAVAEALGATVEWDEATKTVNINKATIVVGDTGSDNILEGYITFDDINTNYKLGWIAVSDSDSRGMSFRHISGIDPNVVVSAERIVEATAKGGEVIFVAGPEPGHIAFSIPWGKDWDYFKFNEILVDESEFLEAYNAYLASKEE